MTPKPLLQAVRYCSDRTVCHDYMRKLKWPSGPVVCPKCANDSCKELASRPGVLKCNGSKSLSMMSSEWLTCPVLINPTPAPRFAPGLLRGDERDGSYHLQYHG